MDESEKEQAEHFPVSRKQKRLLERAIEHWQQQGLINDRQASRLLADMQPAGFDWQRTARYAFVAAIASLLISVAALLTDDWLLALLGWFVALSAITKCLLMTILAGGIFYYGGYRRSRFPQFYYTSETLFFMGVMALASAIYFLGVALDTAQNRVSVLFFIATLLYGVLAVYFPSRLIWVFALVSLASWMGTETGYMSGWGAYYLGMNYPLRFALLGALMTLVGLAGVRARCQGYPETGMSGALVYLSPQTRAVGLLFLFISLWLMSIFGNYGEISRWQQVSQWQLFHWSVLFAVVALAVLWYGLKQDDGAMRGFGVTFLFINLYTRFYEYFWDSLHKGIFFAVLAVSFWWLGSRAETLWQKKRTDQIIQSENPA